MGAFRIAFGATFGILAAIFIFSCGLTLCVASLDQPPHQVTKAKR